VNVFEGGRGTIRVGVYAEALDVAVEVGVELAEARGWAVGPFGCGRTVVIVSGASAGP
jgi:hypothetical protein